MEGNGSALVWNACDLYSRFRSVEQLQTLVQIFHANVSVAVLVGMLDGLDIRDYFETDSIVNNTDFQHIVISLYDLDDQMTFSLLWFQSVNNGIFHKGLDRQGISQESPCFGIWISQEILSSKRIC